MRAVLGHMMFLGRVMGRLTDKSGVVALKCGAIIFVVALMLLSPAVSGAQVKQEAPKPEAVKNTG